MTQMLHRSWTAAREMKFPKFFDDTYAEVDPRAEAICVICVYLRLPFAVLRGHLRFLA